MSKEEQLKRLYKAAKEAKGKVFTAMVLEIVAIENTLMS